MKFILICLALLIIGISACSRPKLCFPEIKALDGDTLFSKGQKIRLLGIDSPEIAQKPFGEQAKIYLENLIKNKKVCCKSGQEAYDKYGRSLAYCWTEDNVFLNAEMIKAGLAISLFIGDKNNEYKALFLALEQEAEEKELGIYNSQNPLSETPYIWRKFHRKLREK